MLAVSVLFHHHLTHTITQEDSERLGYGLRGCGQGTKVLLVETLTETTHLRQALQ